MSLSCLPDEFLKLVIQGVPLRDRLTKCCLVNRRLHAAAVAATDTVVLQGEDTSSLLAWLPQYGHQVTKLELSSFSQPLQQLPCPSLQELKLEFCSVQLGPSADGLPGVLQNCNKLTRLELWCDIKEGPVIDIVSRLVHLQHLHVRPKRLGAAFPEYDCYTIEGLSSATLPCLQQLTCLAVNDLAVENLTQLSALTSLQELHFGVSGGMAVSPTSNLVLPTSLQFFSVESDVEVGVLSLLPTGLRALVLECVVQGLVQGPAQRPDLLLSGVARFGHVETLTLRCDNEAMWPVAGPAYSALTASSSLEKLVVIGRLPEEAVPHMFPTQLRLPQLTYIRFRDTFDEYVDGDLKRQDVWSVADLSRLVDCCPNLSAFEGLSLQHGRHVSLLRDLHHLRHVHVEYCDHGDEVEKFDFEESVKGLAALTRLSCLRFMAVEECPRDALLPLTSLTGLEVLELRLQVCGQVNFYLNEPHRPVWRQLLEFATGYDGNAENS